MEIMKKKKNKPSEQKKMILTCQTIDWIKAIQNDNNLLICNDSSLIIIQTVICIQIE